MSPLRRPFCRPLAIAANDASCEICSVPGALPPTPQNQSPWTPPPEPLHPSHPTGYPSKNIIFLLSKNMTEVAAPSLGAPTTYPPGTKAPGPPLPSPCTPPHPTGYPSKKIIFLLFVRVKNVKNTTQVAKFAPSLGPVPLPPTPPAPKPLDPPSRALVPPPPGYPPSTEALGPPPP